MPCIECDLCFTLFGVTESEWELESDSICPACRSIRACGSCGDVTARVVPCLACGALFCPACHIAVVEDDNEPCEFVCKQCGGETYFRDVLCAFSVSAEHEPHTTTDKRT
jgi:hypothetical protein